MNDFIPIPDLTRQERKILSLLADGLTNRKIADQLYISPSTVKWHIRQLNNKLITNNRKEIVERASEMGLLSHQRDDSQPTLTTVKHNLPNDLTAFMGRETEIAHLQSVLYDGNTRLITITGPGGIGKTRTAISLANTGISHYSDGVFFIPLVGKDNRASIASGMINVFDVELPMEESIESDLFEVLQGRHCLFILDNFEHLLEATEFVTQLLERVPTITLIITSRIRLNVSYEYVYTLGGLDYSEDGIAQKLLIEHMQTQTHQYVFDDTHSPAILRICQLTDGLPLALVLAASWADTLSPHEIAEEIERGIDFLSSDQRDMPHRQSSIRATMDYSWKRMSDKERLIAQKLTVFRGGFDRHAASVVAGATIRDLQMLARRSIITTHDNRYKIHELIRQYVFEHLTQNPHLEELALAMHAEYFGNYLSDRLIEFETSNTESLSDSVLREYDNIRMAWSRVILSQSDGLAIRAMKAMYNAHFGKLSFEIMADWFQKAEVLLTPKISKPMYAKNLIVARVLLGWIATFSDNHVEAYRLALSSEDLDTSLYEEGITKERESMTQALLSDIYYAQGNMDSMLHTAKEALRRSKRSNSQGRQIFIAVSERAIIIAYLHKGDTDKAYEHVQSAYKAVNEISGVVKEEYFINLQLAEAKIAYLQGDSNKAIGLFDQVIENKVASNHFVRLGQLEHYRGQIALDQQLFEDAMQALQKSILQYEQGDFLNQLYSVLGELAYAEIALGQYENARQDIQYALEHAHRNIHALLSAVLAATFLFMRLNTQLDFASKHLLWVAEHPATEIMVRRHAENLIAQYNITLIPSTIDSTNVDKPDVLAQKLSVMLDQLNL
ncbi:MAG: LuxR C-terminal-related transcriptional regulator [Chloroflexota bacterium]